MHGETDDFVDRLRSARKHARMSADMAAERATVELVKLGLPPLTAQALSSVEARRSTKLTRATCNALEAVLSLDVDELWNLLLLDPRKVDPEVRAYYEERMEPPNERRWRENAAANHLHLTIFQQWARALTGAYDEPDDEVRQTLEGMIKSPAGPWRERVARLGNIYLEGLNDVSLWQFALEYTTKEPTAITRALLADRLGVGQRGKSLSQLLCLVGRAK